MNELFLSVEEVASRLNIGRTLAYQLVMRGDIPSAKFGKLRRVHVAELERWAANNGTSQLPGIGKGGADRDAGAAAAQA